jgi:hypothetical protein
VRRVVGVVTAAALMLALGPAVAAAGGLGAGSSRFDLGSQLMLRLFGETSDSTASFAAMHGDRSSESPLRDLALGPASVAKPDASSAIAVAEDHMSLRDLAQYQGSDFGGAPQMSDQQYVVRFTPSSASQNGGDSLVPPVDHFTVAYQPVPPEPAISPAPGTLAFAPPELRVPDYLATTAQAGSLEFEGRESGVSSQAVQDAVRDTTYGAGANFDVRAGQRNVNLNLSSEYEHVGRNDANAFSVSSLDSGSSWQLPSAGGMPLTVPSYADLNRLSLGAGLSVPVTRGLTLDLNYDAQRLYGGYGLPGLVNLDTLNNTYGGKLTFNIPKISSSLSISAYQDRFQDNILQLNGSTQTREDVNFTVKF